ncbi:hypothetical protein O3M35_003053 [Rhynocoris fuscipes]|uniref:Uncharacterized protein n=1 Tax=Rhynocoris fuscipes TaxID=488301 RepID=A0AAW1CL37_9HEMI
MALIIKNGLLSVLLISIVALSNQQADIDHQDVTRIKNQLQSMSTNIDHLTEKVIQDKTLTFPIQTAEIQENQNDGTFKKPTDRKDLLNKLNELKNNITKMINDITTHAGDITSMKDRINMLEKELENLTKQLSNAGRDVQQELKDFSNELSKLTASLNDYYRKQEQKEIDEFLNAIKNKIYDYAALKLSMIKDDNRIKNLTITAYKYVNLDFDILLGFLKSIRDSHQRYLVYKTLYSYLQSNEKDQCDKHVKLHDQLNNDKANRIFPVSMPELNDKSDAFNNFFLTYDPDEFLVAIKCQNYEYAATQISLLNCDKELMNLTISAYKHANLYIDGLLKFAASFKNPHQRFIAYKALYNEIQNNEKDAIWKIKKFLGPISAEARVIVGEFRGYDWISDGAFNADMTELYDKSDPFNLIASTIIELWRYIQVMCSTSYNAPDKIIVTLSNQEADIDHQDVTRIKNQLQSMSTNIDHLTEKVAEDETLTFPILTAEIQENQNDGQFKKPTDRKDLLNKLNELKNNITKMINDITTHAGDITSIKDRINMLEKELENLTKQLSNAGRDVQQELKDFSNQLSNLTASLNDYYRKQEQKEIDEFLNAIKNKIYDYAALKLSMIKDDNRIKNLTITAYKYVNLDFDILLGFLKSIRDSHQRYLVYKTLYSYLQSNEKDQCDKHVKLHDQSHKDKVKRIFPVSMPELNDKSDAFNKFFLTYDPDEFLVAIKCQNYEYAATQLAFINDCDREFMNLTILAYKHANFDIDGLLKFAASFYNPHQRFIAYKALYNEIQNNEKDANWKIKKFDQPISAEVKDTKIAMLGIELTLHGVFNADMTELYDNTDPFIRFVWNAIMASKRKF